MDLSVVIVNWNAREDLGRCLVSLQPALGGLRTETLLIDNASTDGSAALVARRFPWVRVVRLARNRGFAAANNVGLRQTTGRYRLLLNPDTVIHGDALRSMVDFADSSPEVGLLGPRLLNTDGSLQASCRRFPSLGAALLRNTPLGAWWRNNRWVAAYLMAEVSTQRPAPRAPEPRDVDWLSGACLMVRAAALPSLGLLDERYFMYCEDMDWSRRAHAAGWRVVYLPAAVVTHHMGRSSDRVPTQMVCEHHRSMVRYVAKHSGPVAGAVATPLVVGRALAVLIGARLAARLRSAHRSHGNDHPVPRAEDD